MAKGTTVIPEKQPALEELLDLRGIGHAFVREFPIERIVVDEHVQVRLGVERAPKANVSRYATVMKAGGVFPAIVIDHENRLIDGNTRYEAKNRAKQTHIAVYKLDPTSDDALRLLAIELNQANGQAMSNKALRKQVEAYTLAHPEAPLRPEVWERRTGVPARKINEWLKVLTFDEQAMDAGVDVAVLTDADFNDTVKLDLLKLDSKALRKDAVELAARAALNVREVRDLVAETRDAAKDSEAKALDILVARRKDYEASISMGGAVAVRPSKLAQHKMHLSYVAGLDPKDAFGIPVHDRESVLKLLTEVAEKVETMKGNLEGII